MGISATPSQNDNGAHSSRANQGENTQEQSAANTPALPGTESTPDTDEATREHWLRFEAWRVGIN